MGTYYLGIDGGQSSTVALIGDADGRVLGRGQGGPCNHAGAAEGRDKFLRAVRDAVSAACTVAGLPAGTYFDSVCGGFSGGGDDKRLLLAEAVKAGRMEVTNDAMIALEGATGGRPGIVTIAGTGSISYGRNAAGKLARVGGWGHIFGDEGSSFDTVRQALRAALRHEEGWGPPTSLHAAFLNATGGEHMNQVMHWFYTDEYPRSRVAGYAHLVDESAAAGDAVAIEVLNGSAQALAWLTAAARRQLFADDEAVLVCWAGGAFRSDMLRARFKLLVEMDGACQAGPITYLPAAGALLGAYRTAGFSVTLTNVPDSEK